MTMISYQKINDTMPMTAAGEIAPLGLAAFTATCRVYRGLVPISPKTIPMHASAAGAKARRPLNAASTVDMIVAESSLYVEMGCR